MYLYDVGGASSSSSSISGSDEQTSASDWISKQLTLHRLSCQPTLNEVDPVRAGERAPFRGVYHRSIVDPTSVSLRYRRVLQERLVDSWSPELVHAEVPHNGRGLHYDYRFSDQLTLHRQSCQPTRRI